MRWAHVERCLRDYLYDHIPLTKATKVAVVRFDDPSLTLSAPNINHPEIKPRIMIPRNLMEYLESVLGEF